MTKTVLYLILIFSLPFSLKASKGPIKIKSVSHVFINELMADNSSYTDEYGEADDWLELYNANDTTVVLTGLYLSDDEDDLTKWQITTALSIPANGFALFWVDDQIDQGDLHLPFKLSKDGEHVFLSQMEGNNLVIIDEIEFPALAENISYGRHTDGSDDWVYFSNYSPGESNNDQELFFETTIQFSKTSGIYENSTILELSCTDPDAEIRWTSDNSIPTESSNLYNNSITIEETSLIRVAAFKTGYNPTAFSEEFYLLNQDHSLPILQVSIDPSFLWSDEMGMYVTGTNGLYSHCTSSTHNWNQDWERPATLRYIDQEGNLAFHVNAGIKIGGACSRKVSMKPFSIFLRNGTYGDEEIDYKIFPKLDIERFERIKLRSSGTDFSSTKLRDATIQSLLFNQLDIDLMAYQPVVLYLNGEYWGYYALREFYGKHYFQSHHGVDKDNIDYIKIPFSSVAVKEGDDIAWNELTAFIRNNDLTNDANYDQVSKWIDINEFINYYIAEIYIANHDWPYNNLSVWRSRDNGKWRWNLYDTDWSAGFEGWQTTALPSNNAIYNATTDTEVGWPNGEASTLFLRKLLENDRFRKEFTQRSCTIAQTVFAPQRTTHFIDSLVTDVVNEMPATFEKFNNAPEEWRKSEDQPGGGSLEVWEKNIASFKSFFTKRLPYFLENYQNHFGYSGVYNLTFNIDKDTNGKVLLHQNKMLVPNQYNGQYFREIPITIEAVADEGYYFVRWIETGDTSALIEFSAIKDAQLTPLFLEDGSSISENRPFYKVFPNPATNYLYLQYGDLDSNEITVRVYNALGQKVYQESLATNIAIQEHALPIGNWDSGIYFVKTEIGGEVFSSKVLIGGR